MWALHRRAHLEDGMGATAGLVHIVAGSLPPPVALMQVLHDAPEIIDAVLGQTLHNDACQGIILY